MGKWLAFVAILFTVACGSESSSGGAPNDDATPKEPPGNGPGTGVALALPTGTNLAKVVIRRGAIVQVPEYDEFGEFLGMMDQFVEQFRYITNIDPSVTSTINLPYGDNYIVEVIAGDGAGGVLGYYRSDTFDVPETLAPDILPQPPPAITFPDIYVGLGPPYDTYTVGVGVGYPFGGAWSVTCAGASPVSQNGPAATFLSPTVGGTVDCVATLHLDGSLLIAGETASAWELTLAASHDPLPFGVVDVTP